jgi:carbonic anhydrase
VVAVLLQEGKDNALVRELWSDLPKEKEKEELFETVQIDVSTVLPPDRSYYTFSGSLTTPPCSEEVTWFVLKHPMTISAEEIKQFSRLYRNDARPTQPLYDRVVLASQ